MEERLGDERLVWRGKYVGKTTGYLRQQKIATSTHSSPVHQFTHLLLTEKESTVPLQRQEEKLGQLLPFDATVSFNMVHQGQDLFLTALVMH